MPIAIAILLMVTTTSSWNWPPVKPYSHAFLHAQIKSPRERELIVPELIVLNLEAGVGIEPA